MSDITKLNEAIEWSKKTFNLINEKFKAVQESAKKEIANISIWQKKVEADFKSVKDNTIPSQNLLKDSFMLEGTTHYRSSGLVEIEAVHPFTKGFEGPYLFAKPDNAVDNIEFATKDNPFYFGRYYKGSRVSRGGLADGWNGTGRGHILKITKPIRTDADNGGFQSVFFTATNLAISNKRRFRAYIKIVKGSCSFGTDAGYMGVNRGYHVTKQMTDKGEQGWYPLDIVVGTSETVHLTSSAFCMGFDKDEEIEIYLAVPELSIVADSGTNMQIINN